MSTVCVGLCILICSPKIFALLSSGAKWVRELEATHFQSSLSSCDPKGLRIPILSKTGFGLSNIKWWRGQSVCGTWKGLYLKKLSFFQYVQTVEAIWHSSWNQPLSRFKNKSLVAGPILKTRTWCTALKPLVCFCATHINRTLAWQWEHRFTFSPVCPAHGGKAPGPRLCDRVSEIGWSF